MTTYEKALADVRRVVRKVTENTDDPEAAHMYEDSLHKMALRFISNGGLSSDECGMLAEIAMSTGEVDFPRWCA